MDTTAKPRHIGRNISRIRELRGIKQDALAFDLGISQQSVSSMEKSEMVDDARLEEVARVLGVTAEAIKNFSEENMINYFNSFYDNSAPQSTFGNVYNFNPIDKIIELYDKLVQAEKDKVEYLEKLLSKFEK